MVVVVRDMVVVVVARGSGTFAGTEGVLRAGVLRVAWAVGLGLGVRGTGVGKGGGGGS